MKVTIVGMWGSYPKVNGATSGYLFQSQDFHLLVDCGSAVLSKLQQYVDVEKLDAVILSHYHSDHTADIGPLQHARLVKRHMGIEQKTLPIYGHPFDEAEFAKLTSDPDTLGAAFHPEEPLQIGPFTITFLKTDHPVPCYAMRITDGNATVVYSADSAYKDELKEFAKHADIFICECSFYKNMDASNFGHMNSVEAATIAKDAEVKTLVLTHLPQFGNLHNLVTEAKEVFSGHVILAEEGWSWQK